MGGCSGIPRVSTIIGKPCQPFLAPLDIHFYKKDIRDPDVMQPDLLVICDAGEKTDEKGRYMGIPALTLEILSPSTRSIDLVDKLNRCSLDGMFGYLLAIKMSKKLLFCDFI